MLEWLVDWLISRGQKARIYTDLTLISISVCISICTDMNRSPWFWYRLCISLYETPTAYELANGPETADGAETHDAGTHATILDEYSVASGKGWQRHIRRHRGSLYICRVFLLLSSHYILVNTHGSPLHISTIPWLHDDRPEISRLAAAEASPYPEYLIYSSLETHNTCGPSPDYLSTIRSRPLAQVSAYGDHSISPSPSTHCLSPFYHPPHFKWYSLQNPLPLTSTCSSPCHSVHKKICISVDSNPTKSK
jgi:hypothetical protein